MGERAKREFIDCVQRDINGHPSSLGYLPDLPQQSGARQYVVNLSLELATRYDVDYLMTCTLPFMRGGVEKGGCFCENCVKIAKVSGFDLVKAQAV